MERNYELKDLIKTNYGTQAKFGNAIGINPVNLNNKLNGKTVWTAPDITKVRKALHLTPEQTIRFFLS